MIMLVRGEQPMPVVVPVIMSMVMSMIMIVCDFRAVESLLQRSIALGADDTLRQGHDVGYTSC